MQDFDVVGIGAVVVDNLMVLDNFPEEDTKIEIINEQKQLGGPVPTALRQLTNFGLKTSFIGSIGDDENARYIKQELISSNVDISNIINQKNKKSAFANIWINKQNGSRTIAFSTGNLRGFEKSDFKNLPSCKYLHIDGREHDVIKDIINEYKKQNTLISIDTGNFRERTLELLPLCDIVVMPKRFAHNISHKENLKDLAKDIGQKYPDKKIFITDGKNGSASYCDNQTYLQPAYEVDTIDTTGAGDVHCGALLYKLLQNNTIEETLDFAARTAAFKCQFLGNKELALTNDI